MCYRTASLTLAHINTRENTHSNTKTNNKNKNIKFRDQSKFSYTFSPTQVHIYCIYTVNQHSNSLSLLNILTDLSIRGSCLFTSSMPALPLRIDWTVFIICSLDVVKNRFSKHYAICDRDLVVRDHKVPVHGALFGTARILKIKRYHQIHYRISF